MSEMRVVMFSKVIAFASVDCAIGRVIGIRALKATFFGTAVALFFGAGVSDPEADLLIQTRHTFFLPSWLQTYLVVGVPIKAPTFLQVLPTFGAVVVAADAPLKIEPTMKEVAAIKAMYLRIRQ